MGDSLEKMLYEISKICERADQVEAERRKRGECFNVFSVLGLQANEARLHSAFLAELLNPSGSHGMGRAFLDEFLKLIDEKPDYLRGPLKGQIVERSIGKMTQCSGGRLDIVLEDGKNAIIIENKIYAGDQPNQLKRYSNYGKNYDRCRLIYLTLSGDKAGDDSAGETEYCCLSYRVDILRWLTDCVQLACDKPLVRESLFQYIDVIKLLTNQNMDSEFKEKTIGLLIRNPEAAKAIYAVQNDYVAKVVQDNLFPELERFCMERGLVLSGKESFLKDEGCLNMTPVDWNNFEIAMCFEAGRFYIGVVKKESTGPVCDRFECLEECDNEWCGGWSWLPDRFHHFSYDTVPEILSGEFAKEIEKIVDQILCEAKERSDL